MATLTQLLGWAGADKARLARALSSLGLGRGDNPAVLVACECCGGGDMQAALAGATVTRVARVPLGGGESLVLVRYFGVGLSAQVDNPLCAGEARLYADSGVCPCTCDM